MAPKRSFGGSSSTGTTTTVTSLVDALDALPSRPLRFAILLLLANFAGHYFPLLWSDTNRGALLAGGWGARGFSPGAASGESAVGDLDGMKGRANRTALQTGPASSDATRGSATRDRSHGGAGRTGGVGQVENRVGAVGGAGVRKGRGARGEAGGGVEAVRAGGFEGGANVMVQGGEEGGIDKGVDSGGDGLGTVGLTPYVSHMDISVVSEAVCRGIIAPSLYFVDNQKPIHTISDLQGEHRRVLLFMPRHGLGNSLRGYVSAYVYATLAGRRLVRLHAAEHAKVYDTLCAAFTCGFDGIRWSNETGPWGGTMGVYRQLELLQPVQLQSAFKTSGKIKSSLGFTGPIMLSKSPSHFDGFWQFYPRVQACVFSAFRCSSLWCVHSRAIHALLLGPSRLLQEVVGQVLLKHEGEGAPAVASTKGVADGDMFDVALHIRTRPAAIEQIRGHKDEELSRVGCEDEGEGEEDEEGESEGVSGGRGGKKGRAQHEFLKACLWDCIASLLEKLQRDKAARGLDQEGGGGAGETRSSSSSSSGAPLTILLTTDNEALRPEFVRRLARLGQVYYSTGSIVHLSKTASTDMERQRMPTMAEFFLMAKAHTLIEAGSYMSTFAYFAGLLGNATLASIDWEPGVRRGRGGGGGGGGQMCGLKVFHEGEVVEEYGRGGWAGQQGGAAAWER